MAIKTINLKGNQYAPVDERIKEFHKNNPNCSIRTETVLQGDKIIEAKATVIPDVTNLEQYFTGSALGILGKEKALEKLETVAVGRALAFAGLLADGSIASVEEMERFESNQEESIESTIFDENGNYIEVSSSRANQIIDLLSDLSTKNQGYAHYKKINKKTTKIDPDDYNDICSAVNKAFTKN